MYIYLDDERNPKTNKPWVIVRSEEAARELIFALGKVPDYISFDHDLGHDVPTGYDLAKWIETAVLYDMIKWNPKFQFNVHSANPVGAKNIQTRLDNFIRHMV